MVMQDKDGSSATIKPRNLWDLYNLCSGDHIAALFICMVGAISTRICDVQEEKTPKRTPHPVNFCIDISSE